MTNRIDDIFGRARDEGRKLLMPFVCGGYPTAGVTANLLTALDRAGAGVIEVGVPYSDPIADGPVIAAAMHEALGSGVTPASIFEQVAGVRDQVEAGLVAMVSASLVHAPGIGRFCADARDAGFDGLIVPDAPLEESADLTAACKEHGLTLSLLIAPTTPEDRAAKIAEMSTGFVYLLARSGITGESNDAPQIGARVVSLRQSTRLPIACGFGISTPEQVEAVAAHADAAIVGSALVRRLSEAHQHGTPPTSAADEFMTELSLGLVSFEPGG